MTRNFTLAAALSLAYAVALASVTIDERQATLSTASRVWGYGGGPEQRRYSTLSQIDRSNVSRLAVAWTYDTGEPGGMQTQPLVVGDLLYGYTPMHKAFAVNAATGARVWTFDSGLRASGPNRGLMYWTDGTEARVFAAVNSFVYALDAASGVVIESFGTAGRIDLREHLGRDPRTQSVVLTTPGVIYKDLMIVGGRLSESLPAAPGDIRAYDVKTGTLRWSFHTIPRPGEFGSETWPRRAREYAGGANSWSGMAVDEGRGIVFVPTGSAASDFYGADRVGDNLFSNCLIALDANTGRRRWHFQFVRHDIWDRDLPSPPTLVTVQRRGRRIDAVAQATKQGFVFMFDRVTGTPLFPIEDRKYPASTMPGEIARATQPLPLKPAPFSRQRLTAALLSNRTPAVHEWAVRRFRELRSAGQFVPFGVDRPTVVFPGYDGGAEWGGQAFDPETALYYVNANDLAWTGRLAPNTAGQSGRGLYLQHCASCHRDDRLGTPPQIPSLVDIAARRDFGQVTAVVRQGRGRMPGFPHLTPTAVNAIVQFTLTGTDTPPAAGAGRVSTAAQDPRINDSFRFTGYDKFLDPDGYPAVAPPWGTLNAINLNTGEYAWKVPLGEYPELAAQGLTQTGTENYGGPVVTAGGLVFIAATNHDRKMRAFDKATGALLWESTMPSSGNATPAVYEAGGRQFVVVAAGGGKSKSGGPGGVYVAFALPR
ncbi:MAG: PQQ-binding-like beta-propeller repeat protein [Vicinamibacterales bacterium]